MCPLQVGISNDPTAMGSKTTVPQKFKNKYIIGFRISLLEIHLPKNLEYEEIICTFSFREI
jgi:hypothetical protein